MSKRPTWLELRDRIAWALDRERLKDVGWSDAAIGNVQRRASRPSSISQRHANVVLRAIAAELGVYLCPVPRETDI